MALNNFGLGFELAAKDSASAAVVGLGKKIGLLQKNVEDVNQAFEGTTNRTRDLTTGRFVKAPQGLLNKEFMGQVGAALTGIGVVASGVGYGIAHSLSGALDEATKFGKSVAEVASITDRAAFPMEVIEKIGKDMASTYGGDLNLQVKTLYQAVSSGASSAAEATALMHAANKLAVGGLSDSFMAVDALTNVLNAYGMKMTQANEVSDALFTTAKIGKTTIDELAKQIGRVAPTAAAMGVGMDDLMAAVTAGSTQLGNASAAIDGFKEAMSGILKPTADAEKEAKRLGITFSAKALREQGFPKFLASITQNAKFSKDTIGKLFGSMTAFNTMSVLASNNGKAFADALDGMKNKAGATDYAFETLAQTADFASSVLKSNVQTAMVNIGQVIAPVIGRVLTWVNKLFKAFNDGPKWMHKFVAVVGVVGAAIAFLVGGLASGAVAIGGLIIMGKALLIALGVVAVMFGAVVAAAIPLIAIGAALYVAWTRNIGGIQEKVTYWFNRIKLAFQALVMIFEEGGFSGSVLAELNKAENAGIKQFAINVFMWIGRIKNFFRGLGAAFSTGMERVGPIIDKISEAFGRLVSHFSPVKENAKSAESTFQKFGRIGGQVGDFLATVMEKVATGVLLAITFVEGAVAVFEGFKPALTAAWDAAKGLFKAFSDIFAAFGGGKSSLNDQQVTWQTLGNVLGFVANIMITSLTVAIRVVAGVLTWIAGIIAALVTIWDGLTSAIATGVQIVIAIFTGQWGQAWDLAKKMVTDWMTTVLSAFLKVIGGAAGMVDSLGKIFGKDLGLKAKVEGLGAGLAPGGGASPALPAATPPAASGNLAGGAPGVAAAGVAAPAPALIGPPPPPVKTDVTVKSEIVLDNAKVGEAMKKLSVENSGRGFAPTPSPTE